MKSLLESLSARRADLNERLTSVRNLMPAAALDDTDRLSELRESERQLGFGIADNELAQAEAERRLQEQERQTEIDRKIAKAHESASAEKARLEAAQRLDSAIVALETSFWAHERAQLALNIAEPELRRAENMAVCRSLLYSAFWRGAPDLSHALSLPFIPSGRRQSLAESWAKRARQR